MYVEGPSKGVTQKYIPEVLDRTLPEVTEGEPLWTRYLDLADQTTTTQALLKTELRIAYAQAATLHLMYQDIMQGVQ